MARTPKRKPQSTPSERSVSLLSAEAQKDSSRLWFHNQDIPELEMALTPISLSHIRKHTHAHTPSLFSFGSLANRNIPSKEVGPQPGQGTGQLPTLLPYSFMWRHSCYKQLTQREWDGACLLTRSHRAAGGVWFLPAMLRSELSHALLGLGLLRAVFPLLPSWAQTHTP